MQSYWKGSEGSDPRFSYMDRRNTSSVKWNLHNIHQGSQPFVMSMADMDFPISKQIKDTILQKASNMHLGYSRCPPTFKQAISNHIKTYYNCVVPHDRIVESNGLTQFFALCLSLYTAPGEAVVFLTPAYYVFINTTKIQNRKCYESKLLVKDGRLEINFDELEEMMAREDVKMMVLVNPNNPTGRVWSKDEMDKISNIILKTGKVLLSNEIYCDMAYGQFHSFLEYSQTLKENLVVCNSPSKTFNVSGSITGYGIFYSTAMLPQYYYLRLNKFCNFTSVFSFITLQACYESGDEWRQATKSYLRDNYELFRKELAETKLVVFELGASYLVMVDFKEYGMEGKEVMARLEEKNIFIYSLKGFFVEPTQADMTLMRINIACNRDYLMRFLKRFKEMLQEFDKKKGAQVL